MHKEIQKVIDEGDSIGQVQEFCIVTHKDDPHSNIAQIYLCIVNKLTQFIPIDNYVVAGAFGNEFWPGMPINDRAFSLFGDEWYNISNSKVNTMLLLDNNKY